MPPRARTTPREVVEISQSTLTAMLRKIDTPSEREASAMRMCADVTEDNKYLRSTLRETEERLRRTTLELNTAETKGLDVLQWKEDAQLRRDALEQRRQRDEVIMKMLTGLASNVGPMLLGSTPPPEGGDVAVSPTEDRSDLANDLRVVLASFDDELAAEIVSAARGPLLQALFHVVSVLPPDIRGRIISAAPEASLKRLLRATREQQPSSEVT